MGEKVRNWLVVCVQSNREKKTYERLTVLGFEAFLPLQEEIHRWSDRSKKVQRLVVPMVVFARLASTEYIQVLRLPSVNRFMVLRGESTPALIPDSQMERFRFMLDYSEEAICMNYSPLARGKKVRVIKGPLTGLVGELVALDGKSKIAVRLDMLGCACVDMPIGYVEQIGERN